MQFYSIWPYFACMGLLLAVVSLPVFKVADTPPNPGGTRISAIDGLRGFLAFGVFFHHAAIYHVYLMRGEWVLPPSRFYTLLGQAGVALFFMITGYLFWGRMIAERGRPDWVRLYIGRIFRIGPLYLFAIAVMLAIVGWRTGFHAALPLSVIARQIFPWAILGVYGGGPDVNGYAGTGILLAGITWTLAFEWKFYVSLILTALAARNARTHLPFAAIGLIFCLGKLYLAPGSIQNPTGASCAALFFAGMVCASLERRGLAVRLIGIAGTAIVAGLLCGVALIFTGIYGTGPILLLGGVFFLIVCGANLSGLLSSKPARRLGDISYGIYLLQGLVLTLVYSVEPVRLFALASPGGHWLVTCGCAVILLAVAAATHSWIERTGIDLGKRITPKRKFTIINQD
jgi:peptidoglycan/LPS O-acetylase OafA/YrhL